MDQRLAICRFEKDEQIPSWINAGRGFLSITKTSEELSIVCEEAFVLSDVKLKKVGGH